MLKSGSVEEKVRMFNQLNREVRELIEHVVELVYFMRGSIQYEDMMWRTPAEREVIEEFVEKMIEIQKKLPTPTF